MQVWEQISCGDSSEIVVNDDSKFIANHVAEIQNYSIKERLILEKFDFKSPK